MVLNEDLKSAVGQSLNKALQADGQLCVLYARSLRSYYRAKSAQNCPRLSAALCTKSEILMLSELAAGIVGILIGGTSWKSTSYRKRPAKGVQRDCGCAT